jgi:hypothetical protein
MNRRFARTRPLGDDPISAAASAAVAAASSAASSAQMGAPTRPRKKHRRHPVAATADVSSTTAPASSQAEPLSVPLASKKPAKKRHRGTHQTPAGAVAKAGDKDTTVAAVSGEQHGHLLLIGGAVVGLGLLALLLARRGGAEPVPEHQPTRRQPMGHQPMRTA